jgi:hypothetical protein
LPNISSYTTSHLHQIIAPAAETGIVTTDPTYNAVLRPRITIKTIDGADTLYTFDGFEETNPIVVTHVDMEGAIGESGTFSINVHDSNNEIGKDNLHNCKVYLELGKTPTSYQHFLIGYGDIFAIDRPATNYQQYHISGFGSWIQAYRLMIHRREKYKRAESDAKVYNIVDNAFTKRKWRPLKEHDESIQDITGWLRDGISTKVNTPFTVINEAYVYFGDLLDKLCSVTGAVWFVDYSTGDEVLTLTYNSDLHTGVQIKSGDLKTALDKSNTTSYIKRPFIINDDATSQAGVATRLITTNIIDKQEVFHQAADDGRTSLDFRAIAQQVVIDNDARRVESIELTLDKTGDPSSPKDRINGDIVLDVANKPTGTVLDEFHIDLGQIESGKKDIEVDVEISPDKLDVSIAKFWVRLFQRSGNDETVFPEGSHLGDPVHDPNNTIRWFHNNIFSTTQPYYSATASEGDEDKKDKLDWNVTNQGPLYTVNVFSNIRRAIARTNSSAKKRIGLREVFIPTDFLEDPKDITRFMSLALSGSSKARRSVDFLVTIPDNFLFRPYQIVSVSDGLSQTFQDLQVQRARYSIGAQSDDPQVGTLHCAITLSGSYNTLVGNCECL